MTRRGLLKTLAAALVLDPERALWVPGAKTISIPKTNVIVTPQELTALLMRLNANGRNLFSPSNDLATIYRTGKIGNAINIRRPIRFTARNGESL